MRRAAGWGLALGFGLGAAVLCGQGVASAAPDDGSSARTSRSDADQTRRPSAGPPETRARPPRPARSENPGAGRQPGPAARTAAADPPGGGAEWASAPTTVAVELPPMPVEAGKSFAVSPGAIADRAGRYVAAGGDPGDAPRFFFGDLAVTSVDALASRRLSRERVRAELGNLAVSGYFGGVWLRDNLRDAPAAAPAAPMAPAAGLGASAVGLRLFDALAAGLTGLASSPLPGVGRSAARASVPVLLALYGYNRGYLEFLLENPPAGVASGRDTLSCAGFLGCSSTAFPLEIAARYDGALGKLADPATPAWRELASWTSAMEGFTGAGRFVWGMIAQAGAFSPASYGALVDLSSAYLMVAKAAVLASMGGYADADDELAASALLLQAGLWMWSGAYFSGLASTAPRGALPSIAAATA